MSAVSLQEELGLRAPGAPSTWWAPEDGTLGCAVRDVVRSALLVAAVVALFAAPGLVDLAVTALLDGGAR